MSEKEFVQKVSPEKKSCKLSSRSSLLPGQRTPSFVVAFENLRTLARKCCIRYIFFKLLPRSDNELIVSEMKRNEKKEEKRCI